MIDEADEFVAGPQNKIKRPGEPNTPASLKRRRSLSPLLRRPQAPPVVTNHVGGKGPPPAPGSPSYLSLKGVPASKGMLSCGAAAWVVGDLGRRGKGSASVFVQGCYVGVGFFCWLR